MSGGIFDIPSYLTSFIWANSGLHGENVIFGTISQGVGVAWFFFGLFWCRLIFSVLENHLKGLWLSVSVFLVSFLSVVGIAKILLPLAFWQGGMAVVFYYLGYLMRQRLGENINLKALKNNGLASLAVLFIFLIWIRCIRSSHIYLAFGYFGCWETDIIGALGGILITYIVAVLLNKYSNYFKKVIEFIGTESLLILVVHCLDYQLNLFGNYTRINALEGNVNYIMPIVRCLVDVGIVYIYVTVKNLILKKKEYGHKTTGSGI